MLGDISGVRNTYLLQFHDDTIKRDISL